MMIAKTVYYVLLLALTIHQNVDGYRTRSVQGSTRVLNLDYAKDTFNVYFANDKVEGATAYTFKALGHGYGQDTFHVYAMGKQLSGVTKLSFKVLSDGYAKHGLDIYFMGAKVNGANALSFQTIGSGYAKDTYNIYFMNESLRSPAWNIQISGRRLWTRQLLYLCYGKTALRCQCPIFQSPVGRLRT
jgi:hypothetical protein